MADIEQTLSTRDRVFAICNDLYRQNKKPTVRLVLSMLPDISSTSSVHKPFKEWVEEMEAQQQSLYDKLGFSEEFSQSFMREITRFGIEAEERYKNMAIDAKEQRDTAVDDLERTEEKYFKQSSLIEQQAKEIRALKAEQAEIKRAHDATTTELRQQLQEQKASNQELTRTNETLRTEMAKSKVELDHNNTLVSEVKASAGTRQEENDRLRTESIELTRKITRLESTLEGKAEVIQELKGVEKRYETLANERTLLVTDTAKLQQQIEDIQRQLSETKSQMREKTQTEIDLRATIAEQSRVIERFTKQEQDAKVADKPKASKDS